MKRLTLTRQLFLLCLLAVPASLLSLEPAQECRFPESVPHPREFIPETLHNSGANRSEHPPIWVSADAAFDADGFINEELFLQWGVARMETALMQGRPDGCFGPNLSAHTRLRARPAGLTEGALIGFDRMMSETRWALFGEVVASEFGFYNGEPRQLFKLRALASVHQPVEFDDYYLALATGVGNAGDYRFCLSGEGGYSVAPALGDRIVVAANVPGVRTTSFVVPSESVILGHPAQVVVVSSQEVVHAPSFMRSVGVEDLLLDLADAVSRDGYCYVERN